MALGLSRLDDLEVVGADINPRVVDHLRAPERAAGAALVSGIARSRRRVASRPDYRDYFAQLGAHVSARRRPTVGARPAGHLPKTVRVERRRRRTSCAPSRSTSSPSASTGAAFDLVIATNILPYFDDPQLMLAMSNIAAMLAPGGVFLHNEAAADPRRAHDRSRDCRSSSRGAQSSRRSKGAPAPLYDSVFLTAGGEGDPRARSDAAARGIGMGFGID